MWGFIEHYWILLLILAGLAAQIGTTLHLLLNRRDSASTVSWAALVGLAPLTGFALYWVFGINRIERKAHRLRPESSRGADWLQQERVRIVSPYVLPDPTLITTLGLTAMRGVRVDILMPERNNLRFVQWAAQDQAELLLAGGCHLWLTPPPFDHTKLMLVDDTWSFFGSANWDPRSLRLNFEYNLECYDRTLARQLHGLVDRKLADAHAIRKEEISGRALPIRLRDAFARLFMPYL